MPSDVNDRYIGACFSGFLLLAFAPGPKEAELTSRANITTAQEIAQERLEGRAQMMRRSGPVRGADTATGSSQGWGIPSDSLDTLENMAIARLGPHDFVRTFRICIMVGVHIPQDASGCNTSVKSVHVWDSKCFASDDTSAQMLRFNWDVSSWLGAHTRPFIHTPPSHPAKCLLCRSANLITWSMKSD